MGSVSTKIGTEYECEVKPGTKYAFYVLSTEGVEENKKVNLIMDRNICNDGTIPTSDKPCLYAWHWQIQEYDDSDNRYGPDIAMTNLYNGTKGWTNVPDMIMDYYDEGNKKDPTYGYESIITDEITKVTTITGQGKESNYQTFGDITNPLKARLPKEYEVLTLCTISNGSCPMWLVKNLYYDSALNSYCNYCLSEYSENQSNGITNIYGYWLLSSGARSPYGASSVHCHGNVVFNFHTSYVSENGIRPVITVPISYLTD